MEASHWSEYILYTKYPRDQQLYIVPVDNVAELLNLTVQDTYEGDTPEHPNWEPTHVLISCVIRQENHALTFFVTLDID